MPASGAQVRSVNTRHDWSKDTLSPSSPEITGILKKSETDSSLIGRQKGKNSISPNEEEGDCNLLITTTHVTNDKTKGHLIYTVAPEGRPTLDAVLGSIPLVYNCFTKQLQLSSRKHELGNNGQNEVAIHIEHGKLSPMDNDYPLLQRDLQLSTNNVDKETLCSKSSKVNTSSSTEAETEDLDRILEVEKQNKCVGSGDDNENYEHDEDDETKDDYILDIADSHLHRSPTCASLHQTDTSSFTSMSSVGTNLSFYVGEGSSSKAPLCYSCDNLQQCSSSENLYKGAKPKKRGLSSMFLKNFLPWRSKSSVEQHEEIPDHASRSPSACSSSSRRSEEFIATSTTALILENRPANLPAKSFEEEVKHKQEYEEMIKGARKKEIQDAKLKKKQQQQQQKLEEQFIHATKTWNSDILPNWSSSKDTKKTKELWWKGLPPSIRGRVWILAIGNELNITEDLYNICTARSKEKIWISNESQNISKAEDEDSEIIESPADFIKLDVSRTFPQLGIFQEGGPYHSTLQYVLGAYVIYRPDIGYVQGMSFLAAMLLLNMEAADAFISFANLLNRPCQLAFFRVEQKMMNMYYSVYEEFFKENLLKLYNHFSKQNLTPDLYLVDWVYTLFSKSLPLDVACRVWDVFLRDGEEFLFRTALGILCMYEDILLHMEFIHLAQFLTKLPDDIDPDKLFSAIGSIRMTQNKRTFSQLLQQRKDSLLAR